MNHSETANNLKRRLTDIPGVPQKVDIAGASLRIFREGRARQFLWADKKIQIEMLRTGDGPILEGIRNTITALLNSYRNYTESLPDIDSIYITHPKNNLHLVMDEVISAEPEEAFCFFDEGKLRNKVGFLRDHFLPESPEKEFRRIAYAIKANPKSRIVQILSEEGIDGFDCASPGEIDQVLNQNPNTEI